MIEHQILMGMNRSDCGFRRPITVYNGCIIGLFFHFLSDITNIAAVFNPSNQRYQGGKQPVQRGRAFAFFGQMKKPAKLYVIVPAAVAVIMIGAIPVLLIMAAITGTVTVDTDDIRKRYRAATRTGALDVEVIRSDDAEEDN